MGAFSDLLRFLKLKPPKHNYKGDYWQRRKQLHYYQVVRAWIEALSPGDWILDVGSRSTPIVKTGQFKRRTMIDIAPFNRKFAGVEQVVADWMAYPVGEKAADVVLCLQVLEHLPDDLVGPFARKLLHAGKKTIISVPHRWPEDLTPHHLQDPVDLDKLITWTGKPPVKHHIERRDNMERLVALFD
ncbi:MAG: class I SAM-dependent methyltransferase [Saprospiraceae bacterium]|nr:class I SAM-dependent methyltransferase [Saprospiraceae bacterium]